MYPKLENVYVKGPFLNGNNTVFKITEKKNNKKIPLQLISPFLLIHTFSEDYSYFLTSYDNLNTQESIHFVSFLESIENAIQSNASKFLKSNKNSPKFNSCIKKWNNDHYLQLRRNHHNVEVYDSNKEKVSFQDISKKSLVKMMIWFNDLVICNEKWYINLNIMQVKLYDPLPPIGCVIDVETSIHTNKETINSSITDPKYQRMLKMGVPLEAVKSKMRIDGQLPSLNNSPPMLPFKPNMLNSIKLKKVTIDRSKPRIRKSNTNQLIPSLEDIQLKLNSLRKTRDNPLII